MPVYEYNCPQCGIFEVMQKVSDPVLRRCPECKRAVTKLISASSFQFKGTGWYVTDYGRKANGKQSKKSSEGAKSKENVSEAKGSEASSSKEGTHPPGEGTK